MYISSFKQARFIRIHTWLYLYPCYFILTSIVKNDLSFTAQAVVIMITIQKWKKKKERKSTLPFSKIRSRENFRCGRYHKTSKAFSNVHGVKNFYLNKTDVIITVNTSKVFRVLVQEVLGLRFWVFVLETSAHCSWWKRTSWWSSRTWFVFTSSLIILISRRRSFWTTRTWTSRFHSNNLPDDWIHRRKEIQNGCR